MAILGAVSDHDHLVLSRMQHHAATALAVAIDVAAWTGDGGQDPTSVWLAGQGWRAVSLGPRSKLPAVWQELGRTSNRRRSGAAYVEVGDAAALASPEAIL